MKDERTLGERISDTIAQWGGSWKFIFLFSILLIVWIVINSLTYFEVISWDKYPYILLNLLLSFVAAFQAPFIMMSQNRAEKKQDTAYRILFQEIKELVEQDIQNEHVIEQLSRDIKKEQEMTKEQHAKLLSAIHQAIELQELNRHELAEILIKHIEEEEE